jgi:hypothetical protein
VSVVAVAGILVALVLAAAAVVIVLTRHSHVRWWRFGVFYESEDRYGDRPDKGED